MKQPPFVNYNGAIIAQDEPAVPSSNRAFLYGDGLFETIRINKGKILFLADHLERLKRGAAVLKLELPPQLSAEMLSASIADLAHRNQAGNNARVRLTVYREGKGKYLPLSHRSGFLLSLVPLQEAYQLNDSGLTVGLFPETKKSADLLSSLKTCNALLYILASAYAQKNEWDDCLLMNTGGKVIEATASNLFLVSKGVIYTPPLSEGPVEGVMRKQILKQLKNDFQIIEKELTAGMLSSADELFLTNCISGIRWVKSFQDRNLNKDLSERVFKKLEHVLAAG